jgi:cholesterol transport system auxiliary component
MIRPARPAATAGLILALGMLSLGLGGCITLFEKQKPAQLYRFGAVVQPAPAGPGAPFAVRGGPIAFDAAAGGDRLLTVTGDEAAYIDGARWVAPASELFQEAVEHGFTAAGGRGRLVGPGPARADYRLTLQVTRFEARYINGPAAAPTVVVHLQATLERQSDMTVVAEKEFDDQAAASDNRVGAIVSAYDAAAAQTVADLVNWVDETARG